jgi:hypothetical protein
MASSQSLRSEWLWSDQWTQKAIANRTMKRNSMKSKGHQAPFVEVLDGVLVEGLVVGFIAARVAVRSMLRISNSIEGEISQRSRTYAIRAASPNGAEFRRNAFAFRQTG